MIKPEGSTAGLYKASHICRQSPKQGLTLNNVTGTYNKAAEQRNLIVILCTGYIVGNTRRMLDAVESMSDDEITVNS